MPGFRVAFKVKDKSIDIVRRVANAKCFDNLKG
jgi:hypothetical protein